MRLSKTVDGRQFAPNVGKRCKSRCLDGGQAIEFHRCAVKLGHLHHKQLDVFESEVLVKIAQSHFFGNHGDCLLYTSDAADE